MRGMSIDLLDIYPLFLSHNERPYGFGMAVSLGLRHGWLDGWADGRMGGQKRIERISPLKMYSSFGLAIFLAKVRGYLPRRSEV